MAKKLMMGNEAIAHGAIAAGVNVVCGYPGTPSTEVLETVAKYDCDDIHVEWSTNEKAALELAAGASYCGARVMVTMKQVGLNVASDPLMSLAYIGVKGGFVVLVADDPGPISSQTEQDTRSFAQYSKLPIFDPSSPEEAYAMIKDAFILSEKYHTPVIVRPTTRVCHACAPIELEARTPHLIEGFERSPKWIIFPKRAYEAHGEINTRLAQIAEDFDRCNYNGVCDVIAREDEPVQKGIATGGISDAYALEALSNFDENYRLFYLATPFPFPTKLALEFLSGLDELIVFEELDPVIEQGLIQTCGLYNIDVIIRGKLSGDTNARGENSVDSIQTSLACFFGRSDTRYAADSIHRNAVCTQPAKAQNAHDGIAPALPVRPPVLCAGCPHRGSFYAVKKALGKQPARFSGDIGCYTLGNAMPLDMIDTCLCMGAGITIAQGMHLAEPSMKNIAFIGDSTFFASGITGIVNAIYNNHDITIVILDNSTTAMTGQQPHPGTGKNAKGEIASKISIDGVLRGLGLSCITHANPLDLDASIAAVQEAISCESVSAVIFESPCISLIKPQPCVTIDEESCIGCMQCIKKLGCPALSMKDKLAIVDSNLCYGCNLCAQICPTGAICTAAMQEGGAQ